MKYIMTLIYIYIICKYEELIKYICMYIYTHNISTSLNTFDIINLDNFIIYVELVSLIGNENKKCIFYHILHLPSANRDENKFPHNPKGLQGN